jgi:uncharacterized protein YqgC (DUF456 family)
MYLVWLLLLLLVLALSWCLTLFSLPGNWLIVLAAAVYASLTISDGEPEIGWVTVAVLAGLATAGEVLEFAAGAFGTSRAGGSKRGALLAIAGAVIGSGVGAMVGLPIPVVGSIVGVLLFASLGAMTGAIVGESWKGRTLDESIEVGQAAFWARLAGTLAKIGIGTAMVLVAALAAVL